MWTRLNDIDRMFSAMDQIQSRMNRMNSLFSDFDRFYGNARQWQTMTGMPKTNLYDAGDHLEIKAEIAGLSKDDLSIKIQGNYLELNGNRKAEAPEGYTAHRKERETQTFSRSFTLPSDIDADKVEASLKNGILTLTLPKAEAAKPKQVTIN